MLDKPMRIAVATKEGQAVSEHFGHSKVFYIYDVTASSCKQIGKREIAHYCLGGHSDKSALMGIFEAIKDCSAVFVAKIGDGPTEKLQARGIDAISDYAWQDIDTSLHDYVKNLRNL